MYEIDGTAYTSKTAYRRCLEKMKTSSKRTLRTLRKLHQRATDPAYKELIEEAYKVELSHLAYSHFNLAWLNKPDVFKHYPAEIEESEGVNNDTTRS